jgi:hypothetical protein
MGLTIISYLYVIDLLCPPSVITANALNIILNNQSIDYVLTESILLIKMMVEHAYEI